MFFCFVSCVGSALMSIVGVYKEIQDQHMNIVSIMKLNNETEYEFIGWCSFVIFTVESFLCGFVGAVGNESRTGYESCAGKNSDSHALYYHILTNKLFQINFKQLYLISSGFLTCFLPTKKIKKTNWIILENFVFAKSFRTWFYMRLFMWPHIV